MHFFQAFVGASLPPHDPLSLTDEGQEVKHYCSEICNYRRLDGFTFANARSIPIETAIHAALPAVRHLDMDKVLVGHGKHEVCRFVSEDALTLVYVKDDMLIVHVKLRSREFEQIECERN